MRFETGRNNTSSRMESPERVIEKYESSRIVADESFADKYSQYRRDMEITDKLWQKYDGKTPDNKLGKMAEAAVFLSLKKHPINEIATFRPTNLYDDYMHGADLVVEPKNTSIQSVAAIDITTHQEDIKGLQRQNGEVADARPVGLEAKLLRTKQYSDYLADIDVSQARDLSAWLESGGLHEDWTPELDPLFKQAEKLFLMKYYKTPESSPEPMRTGFVIGGPQAIISLDQMFINKTLNGSRQENDLVADIAVLEFAYCVQAEQKYLDEKVKDSSVRNIFFDTHYSKVRAWSNVLERPKTKALIESLVSKNQGIQEFREQLGYYGKAFQKVYGGR